MHGRFVNTRRSHLFHGLAKNTRCTDPRITIAPTREELIAPAYVAAE
jgi:hypothetical protein